MDQKYVTQPVPVEQKISDFEQREIARRQFQHEHPPVGKLIERLSRLEYQSEHINGNKKYVQQMLKGRLQDLEFQLDKLKKQVMMVENTIDKVKRM